MSLSVLIPVYNRDVTLLVSSLATLLTKEKILSEIILLDDASTEEYATLNQKLSETDFIFYHRNNSNLGRAKTRMLLAESARYHHLLFLDCDIKIIRPDFISQYHEELKAGTDICCGGIVYDENEPTDSRCKLHWKYGTFREVKAPRKAGFLSSNFLIKRDLFLEFDIGTNLGQYGHEDTIWGIQLSKRGIDIKFIDNPVMHEGLEETSAFIKKSLEAVENLLIMEKMFDRDVLTRHVRLYKWYKKTNSVFLSSLIEKTEARLHPYIIKNLSSDNPSLRYFDWLRLAHLIRMKKSAIQ